MLILGVDFDGTIVDHEYPDIGDAVPLAIDYLKQFQEAGARIMLWTMRSGNELQEAVDYLSTVGINLWGINENPEQHTWTDSKKQYAHMYIDDAAFGCPLMMPKNFLRRCVDWSVVGPEVLKILKP